MIEYQAIASSSTYHQTLANDERKRHFPFFSNPRQILQNYPPIPLNYCSAPPCFPLFLFHSVFLSPFRAILHK